MPPGTPNDAADLLARIAEGDEAAFAAFYRAFESRVFRFIRSKLNDSGEAADILNEVFLEVWRNADRFEGRAKVSTWLFGVAFHKTMDRLRKNVPVPVADEQIPEQADEDPDAAQLLNASEEVDHLRDCIGKLSADHRAVVELAFFEDLPYGEIAEIVGRPEGTVKTRMYHAKQALKDCLSKRIGFER